MMSFEEIKEKLKDRNLVEVAKRSGLTYSTLWNFSKAQKPDNFTILTFIKLSNYLERF